jgi:Kef-type K+ transport system membrane component KefB
VTQSLTAASESDPLADPGRPDAQTVAGRSWVLWPRAGRGVLVSLLLSAVAAAVVVVAVHWGLPSGDPASGDSEVERSAQASSPMAALARLGLALVVVSVLARVGAALAVRLGQPRVVGEILAGVVLGPSVLGALAPDLLARLLPPEVASDLGMLGLIGLVFTMAAIGRDLHRDTRGGGVSTVTTSLALMAVPFAAGVAVAVPLLPLIGGDDARPLAVVLFLGTAMSVTAFPVLVRLVADAGLRRTRLGSLAILSAATCDVIAWAALAVPLALAHAGNPLAAARSLLLTAVVVAGLLYVVRPALQRVTDAAAGVAPRTSRSVVVILTLVCGMALVTELLGVHPILGAGMVLPHDAVHVRDLPERIGAVNAGILLPVYFATAGQQVDIGSALDDARLVLAGLALLGIAFASKLGAAALLGRVGGLPLRESLGFGVLMNARGITEIIVLDAGRSAGLIGQEAFTVMVFIALASTVAVAPALRALGIQRPAATDALVADRAT